MSQHYDLPARTVIGIFVCDRLRRHVCSELAQLQEVKPDTLLMTVESKVMEEPLAQAIARQMANRVENDKISGLSPIKEDALRKRAKRSGDAEAAILGIEAWLQGAQIPYVTQSSPTADETSAK